MNLDAREYVDDLTNRTLRRMHTKRTQEQAIRVDLDPLDATSHLVEDSRLRSSALDDPERTRLSRGRTEHEMLFRNPHTARRFLLERESVEKGPAVGDDFNAKRQPPLAAAEQRREAPVRPRNFLHDRGRRCCFSQELERFDDTALPGAIWTDQHRQAVEIDVHVREGP